MKKEDLLHYLKQTATEVDRAMAEDIGPNGTAGVQDQLLQQILEHALLSGGKRVRPVICATAAALCKKNGNSSAAPHLRAIDPAYVRGVRGAGPLAQICGTADQFQSEGLRNICSPAGKRIQKTDTTVFLFVASLEYLHGASLLHDDIIDGAIKRRGKTATHSRFGLTPAILAGDFLHARAMDLAGSLGGHDCLAALSRATSAMIHGEFVQMAHIGNPKLSEEEYYTIITGKTAALLESSCEVGAIYGGATTEQRQALRSYGMELGLAFQMVDDLLDYLGDPAVTGKPQGTDLGEGKATLPLIHALKNADTNDAPKLERLFLASKNTPEAIQQASKMIDKYNGFHYTRKKACEHGQKALEALESFDPLRDETRFLSGMVRYVLERNK